MTPKSKNISTAVLALFALVLIVRAQQPVTYKLNPEASQRWQQLDKAQEDVIKEANRQLGEIAAQKTALLIGAGIPASERDRPWEAKAGIVEFAPKAVTKASPTP